MFKKIKIVFIFLLIAAAALTLFACNKDEKFTVTVNFMVDGVVYETVTVNQDNLVNVEFPAAPEKTGYSFGGWYFDQETLENEFKSLIGYNKTATVEVYAKWAPRSYIITYDVNGGEPLESNTRMATFGENTVLEVPEYEGYFFAGWYNGTGLVSDGPWSIPSDVTLTAAWTPQPFKATFNSMGGAAVAEIEGGYMSPIAAPVSPAWTGLTFVNWFTSDDGGVTLSAAPYVFNTMPLGGVTLYAKWQLNAPTVTSDLANLTEVYNGANSLSVAAAHAQPQATLSYQWFYSSGEDFAPASNNATGNTIAVSAVSLSGAYYCKITATFGTYTSSVSSASAIVTITPKQLALTGVTAANRQYDGTTSVTLSGGALSGVIVGDEVGFTLGDGTVASANAFETPYDVSFTVTLTGTDKDNYTCPPPAGVTATISKADFDMTGVKKAYKAYDVIYEYTEPIVYNDYANIILLIGLPQGLTAVFDGKRYGAVGKFQISFTFEYDIQNYNEPDYETTFEFEILGIDLPITVWYSGGPLIVGDSLPTLSFSGGISMFDTVTLDAGQTLEAGAHEYDWTFTPYLDGYAQKKGKITLVVFAEPPFGLSIASQPNKMEYYANEELETAGLVAKLVFETAEEVEISDYEIVYQTDAGCFQYGDTKVTIMYGGLSADIEITVLQLDYEFSYELPEYWYSHIDLPEIFDHIEDGYFEWEERTEWTPGAYNTPFTFYPDDTNYKPYQGATEIYWLFRAVNSFEIFESILLHIPEKAHEIYDQIWSYGFFESFAPNELNNDLLDLLGVEDDTLRVEVDYRDLEVVGDEGYLVLETHHQYYVTLRIYGSIYVGEGEDAELVEFLLDTFGAWMFPCHMLTDYLLLDNSNYHYGYYEVNSEHPVISLNPDYCFPEPYFTIYITDLDGSQDFTLQIGGNDLYIVIEFDDVFDEARGITIHRSYRTAINVEYDPPYFSEFKVNGVEYKDIGEDEGWSFEIYTDSPEFTLKVEYDTEYYVLFDYFGDPILPGLHTFIYVPYMNYYYLTVAAKSDECIGDEIYLYFYPYTHVKAGYALFVGEDEDEALDMYFEFEYGRPVFYFENYDRHGFKWFDFELDDGYTWKIYRNGELFDENSLDYGENFFELRVYDALDNVVEVVEIRLYFSLPDYIDADWMWTGDLKTLQYLATTEEEEYTVLLEPFNDYYPIYSVNGAVGPYPEGVELSGLTPGYNSVYAVLYYTAGEVSYYIGIDMNIYIAVPDVRQKIDEIDGRGFYLNLNTSEWSSRAFYFYDYALHVELDATRTLEEWAEQMEPVFLNNNNPTYAAEIKFNDGQFVIEFYKNLAPYFELPISFSVNGEHNDDVGAAICFNDDVMLSGYSEVEFDDENNASVSITSGQYLIVGLSNPYARLKVTGSVIIEGVGEDTWELEYFAEYYEGDYCGLGYFAYFWFELEEHYDYTVEITSTSGEVTVTYTLTVDEISPVALFEVEFGGIVYQAIFGSYDSDVYWDDYDDVWLLIFDPSPDVEEGDVITITVTTDITVYDGTFHKLPSAASYTFDLKVYNYYGGLFASFFLDYMDMLISVTFDFDNSYYD
ncbi:MAG TPA: InlB B-repeat-containing protein [Clostridia bacterium]|nr:InlB B-repeat-containing protein [Clostridia bacterium]